MSSLPVVAPEFEYLLSNYTWSLKRDPRCDAVYFTSKIGGKTKYLHRMIMGEPDGQVDHKDRDFYNCRRSNLRVATASQNQANRGVQKNSTTKVKGVFPHGDRFRSYIRVEGKQIWLGAFDTIEEAKKVYDAAAKRHFGEFACQ